MSGITRRCLFKIFFLVAFLLVSFGAVAQSSQPAVAIKSLKMGEGVPSAIKKRLNLGTLLSEMEAAFQATRKFRVLSRNKADLQAILEEQDLASSDLAKGDAAASGEIDNANYLILPTVQDFKFYREHKALPNFDSKFKRSDWGLLEISAKMIDTSTGQVMTTFSLKSSFKAKDIIVNDKNGIPSSVHFTKMAKAISAELADQTVAKVFPMKVVKRDRRGRIYINRGSDGGLKKGEILEVFYAGEELIDPDTGESLGASEEYVGEVKVGRINPKMTVAKIVSEEDPDMAPIGVGDILRRPQ
ncbi:hypothetical protein MNBD_GAMMA16-704 [hydrothermal vent metagenome]|uniref:Uncharacterized protein n=1 Tax=hydrothermal vent metagenome TaxID=652676 RepID=A0A3B0YTT1_9ZZZZ